MRPRKGWSLLWYWHLREIRERFRNYHHEASGRNADKNRAGEDNFNLKKHETLPFLCHLKETYSRKKKKRRWRRGMGARDARLWKSADEKMVLKLYYIRFTKHQNSFSRLEPAIALWSVNYLIDASSLWNAIITWFSNEVARLDVYPFFHAVSLHEFTLRMQNWIPLSKRLEPAINVTVKLCQVVWDCFSRIL